MAAKKKAVRYNEDQRKEIIAFIEDFNAKNGRGGQTAAVKKFNVSTISINNWMKKSGKGKTRGKAKVVVRNPAKLFSKLNEVNAEIAKHEKALAKLKDQAKTLRKSLLSAVQ